MNHDKPKRPSGEAVHRRDSDPPDKHDRSYRWFFSHPEMVEDLLRGFVHRDWVQELDFASLEQVSEVFIGDKLDLRASDSVWRVRWRDAPMYICLAFEFQSTPERFMAVRWMVYVGMIYQRLIGNAKVGAREKLPPVLPIVIYNGRAPWRSAEELSELIEPVPGLVEFMPRLRYLMLDEHRLDRHRLAAMSNRVAALFGLELSSSPAEVLRGIERVLELVPAGHLLRQVFAAWLRLVLIPARVTGASLPAGVNDLEECKTMLEESLREWEQNWLQQGIEKGRSEGLRRGRREGEASLLLQLLEMKFGTVPDSVKALLDAASSPQLQEWGQRVLTAATLDEVLGCGR